MTDPNDDNLSDIDRATRDRLGLLRTLPIDTSSLARSLSAQLPASESTDAVIAKPSRSFWSGWRPRIAIAAVLLMALSLAISVVSNGGPVMASAATMAAVHEDIVAGRVHVTQVDSLDAANRALAELSPRSTQLPTMPMPVTQQAQPPTAHVMACCMRSVKDKDLSCVLLMRDGVPITLSVAAARDMASHKADGESIQYNGSTYQVQTFAKLTMVASERDGRWVCLIGALPAEELMKLLAGLQF